MNERILELRTQAAAWVAKNHQPQDPNAYSQKEIDQRYLMYEEKFAELIVQECILTIQMGITRDGHNTEKYLCSIKHIKQIKEHFGVEE